MPAKSKSQQHFMGMVYALKSGKLKPSKLPKSVAAKVKKAAGSMSKKSAKDFASTKTKGLPKKVKEDSFDLDNMTLKDYLVFEHVLRQELTEEDLLLVGQVLEEDAK